MQYKKLSSFWSVRDQTFKMDFWTCNLWRKSPCLFALKLWSHSSLVIKIKLKMGKLIRGIRVGLQLTRLESCPTSSTGLATVELHGSPAVIMPGLGGSWRGAWGRLAWGWVVILVGVMNTWGWLVVVVRRVMIWGSIFRERRPPCGQSVVIQDTWVTTHNQHLRYLRKICALTVHISRTLMQLRAMYFIMDIETAWKLGIWSTYWGCTICTCTQHYLIN